MRKEQEAVTEAERILAEARRGSWKSSMISEGDMAIRAAENILRETKEGFSQIIRFAELSKKVLADKSTINIAYPEDDRYERDMQRILVLRSTDKQLRMLLRATKLQNRGQDPEGCIELVWLNEDLATEGLIQLTNNPDEPFIAIKQGEVQKYFVRLWDRGGTGNFFAKDGNETMSIGEIGVVLEQLGTAGADKDLTKKSVAVLRRQCNVREVRSSLLGLTINLPYNLEVVCL